MEQENEYDVFGDTRNKRGREEDDNAKQRKGKKDKNRIYKLKMKREEQSKEDKKKDEKEDLEVKEEKSKKRILKEIPLDEEDYGNNTQELPQKKQKKKVPKKGRVRF